MDSSPDRSLAPSAPPAHRRKGTRVLPEGGVGGGGDRAGGAGNGRGHRALAGEAAGHERHLQLPSAGEVPPPCVTSSTPRPRHPALALDDRDTRSSAPSSFRSPPEVREEGRFNQRICLSPPATATTTPQSLSGLKRKRTPRQANVPEAERAQVAEQVFVGNEAEEDVGLDQMGEGWSEHAYGGEDSDDFDRGYTVEGVIEPHMIDGFLHGEENRQFRSKVWEEFTKIRVGGVVTKGQCVHCNKEISAKRGAGTSAMSTHLRRCKARMSVNRVVNQL